MWTVNPGPKKPKAAVMKPMTVNVISESAFTAQAHGVHTTFSENCVMLRRLQDVDLRVNALRKSDLVHIHTVGPYALLHLLLGRSTKIVTAHLTPGSFVGSVRGGQSLSSVVRRYLVWFYNKADAVLAVSEQVLTDLVDLGVSTPIYVLPNSLDTTRFRCTKDTRTSARAKLGIDPGSFVVLSVGQVQPRKRVSVFVECARSLPEVRFVWVGGILFGPISAGRRDLTRLMDTAPDNVTFVGKLDRGRLIDYYRAADLFFFPSAHETFGMVIIEAASAGLPLLLRDLAQYRRTFPDAYVPGDETTFVNLIAKFASDDNFRAHWRSRSATLVAEYDSKRGVERLMRTYRAVLCPRAGET